MPAVRMDYNSGRDTVLDVARTDRAQFYNIIDNPDNWYVQTRCSEWEVRDIVGHMIDVTEGYLTAGDMARKGETGNALGLLVMSDRLNEHALAFRSLSREEAISRLKNDSDQAFAIFETPSPLKSGWAPTAPDLHGTYTNLLLSIFPDHRLWYPYLGHEVGPWR